MKILVIYPEYKDATTGGQIYDHYFIDRIILKKNYTIDFLTDSMLCSNSKYLYNIVYLKEFFRARKYDIILTNSRLYTRLILLFFFLRLFSKSKLISIHHHFNFFGEEKFIPHKIHKFLELRFLKFCYSTIIPSPYVKDVFQNLLPKKRFFYLQLAFEKRLIIKKELKNEEADLLYVGTIERRKGLIFLLKALLLLKSEDIVFHCNIVGKVIDEDYYSFLRRFVTEKGLDSNVSFYGRVSRGDLDNFYRKATCFVFPSLLEGFGMVIIEAMSFGVPVVAFNNSAMPYAIKHLENGLLAENKNFIDFNCCILQVLNDKILRNKLSEGAYNTYQKARGYDDLDSEIDFLCQSKFDTVELNK
ncbi:MAG: glycosyltransferase family 4 protein [Paludibacteraceae bacterium]|nr:glycosyltransferase family 4 protein [Paludibacteraceae bacterium]